MVLPTGSRRHKRHLRQGHNDGQVAKENPDVFVYGAGEATIDERVSRRKQDILPRARKDGGESQGGDEAEIPPQLLLLAQSCHIAAIVPKR